MNKFSYLRTQRVTATCRSLLNRTGASDPMAQPLYMNLLWGLAKGLLPGLFMMTLGSVAYLLVWYGVSMVALLISDGQFNGWSAALLLMMSLVQAGLLWWVWRRHKTKHT